MREGEGFYHKAVRQFAARERQWLLARRGAAPKQNVQLKKQNIELPAHRPAIQHPQPGLQAH